jgi:ABC-2 type transport system ATP-binding protein
MSIIETTNLTKHFGETVAVDSLDLEVERGSVHGLVGPNGAGKTTAMQLIIGLLSPTEGEAAVAGEPAGSLAAKEKIGYAPQDLALYDSMTGREYLEYMGKVAGMDSSAVADRADELLDWLDMTDAADRPTGEYSGGMRQRIGLAQAMIHEPELLLLDEPTRGLDPTGRQKIMDSLESLPDEGITVFVSSHVLSELEQYINDVTILQDGRHVMTDTIDAVQDAYGGEAFSVETGDNEAVLALLEGHELVQSVEVEDGALLVMTDQPEEFRQALQQLLVDEGISLRSLSEEGTLQEAFADIVASNNSGAQDAAESEGGESA